MGEKSKACRARARELQRREKASGYRVCEFSLFRGLRKSNRVIKRDGRVHTLTSTVEVRTRFALERAQSIFKQAKYGDIKMGEAAFFRVRAKARISETKFIRARDIVGRVGRRKLLKTRLFLRARAFCVHHTVARETENGSPLRRAGWFCKNDDM